MNTLEIIGLLGSVASIGSAIFAAYKARKAKEYSDIYHTTDTKEKLQNVFTKLEHLQEIMYKLNSSETRGIIKDKELKEYKDIRDKLNSIINLVPSNYNIIITHLNNMVAKVDSCIQSESVMNSTDLFSFKGNIPVILGEVKKELESLRSNLTRLQQ
ncbi:hypothetical protein J0K78_06295 [Halobacillus sp. GSS1]|uniref:hypothetical protein n=1 Tax=Halobacillus sp. GSS1 TaxID=2815919 RepID=UPI001A8FF5AC|nr:hypothetical protein [Halobacillus sp. GSS1]MBN9653870.1 hypothetical protein [Halobacillus sp. GSS1]